MAASAVERLHLVRARQHPDRAAHGGARSRGRSSGCCTRRTSRRCGSSACASATAIRSRGKISSRATSTTKGHFVVLTKDDFKAAAVEKTRTIDIIDFVKAEEIDDRFFETPYYLVPAKGGERAYALLREAIRESGRIGIAKFILRDAQHLAAVEVIDQALVLSRDAVRRRAGRRQRSSSFPATTGVRKPELDMAKALVNSLAAEWDPAKYTDEYRDNLMRIIKAKVKGKKVDARRRARAAAGRGRRPDGAPAPQPRAGRRQSRARGAKRARKRVRRKKRHAA